MFARPDHVRVLRTLATVSGVRVWHYGLPILLAVVAALLEGMAMALLVPLANGLANDDFGFVWRIGSVRAIFDQLPDSLSAEASPNRSAFLLIVFALFATSTAGLLCTSLAARIGAWRDATFVARLKPFTLARCLSFGKLYFDRASVANLSDICGYSEVVVKILSLLEGAVDSFFRLVAQVVVMATISWPLTLFMGLALPLSRVVDRRIVARIRAVAERQTEAELVFSRRHYNALSCVPLVKAYALEARTTKEYATLTEQIRGLTLAREQARLAAAPLQQAVVLCALLGVVCLAVLATGSDRTADLAVICAFLLVGRRAVPLLGFATTLRVGLAQIRPYLDRLALLFDDRDKFFVADGTGEFAGLRDGIEIRDLRFSYGEGAPVLRGLNARVPAGQTTALVGETGCGKTTMASLIARLYECPEGSVLFDGRDVRELSRASLARRIAFVGQDAWLFNDSLRRNLTAGLERPASDAELTTALECVQLGGLLARVPGGLDADIGDRGVRLSGGEKQRICIARALLRKADLIILDEATSALDSETEHQVLKSICRATAGRTVLVIAHRLSTIREADQILVLSRGEVIQAGGWRQLVNAPGPFSRMWEAQTGSGAVSAG